MSNTEIEAAFARFKGKRALVMGLGLWQGGVEAVKFLHRWGASEIVVTDLRDAATLAPSLEAIKHIPVTLRLGEHREADFARAQVVIHSPAVRPDNKYLEAARKAGAEVTQEMSLFIEACPAKTVGITGSNGKTTTTLLCYEMLCEVYQRAQPELEGKWADPVGAQHAAPLQKARVWLGGNVGTPLINRLEEITKDDVVVLELSSFQLMDWHRIKKSCDVALITNITPNHLDWHKDFSEYVWAKKAIYFNRNDGCVILNQNALSLHDLGWEALARGKKLWTYAFFHDEADVWGWFDGPGHVKSVVWDSGGAVNGWLSGPSPGLIEVVRDSLALPGDFNWSNALGAMALAAVVVQIAKTANTAIKGALGRFRGAEHRLEPCGSINGARVYNDSIATDPAATLAALSAFDKGVHLILGGGSKNIDYTELGKRISTHGGIKAIYLQGTTAPAIKAAVGATYMSPLHECATFDEACERAFNALTPGDVLLMSPASTSFYEYAPGKKFANFEERGKYFKALVNKKLMEPRPEGRGPGNA